MDFISIKSKEKIFKAISIILAIAMIFVLLKPFSSIEVESYNFV